MANADESTWAAGSEQTAARAAGTAAAGRQVQRLASEWRNLQRAFAYHPHVRVIAVEGEPPEQYRIEYRVRTVIVDEHEELQYSENAAVALVLPVQFPQESPIVRPISRIFHPNVTAEQINIDRFWTSTASSLIDVVVGVGMMLSYQDFDAAAVWNPTAMAWAEANPRVLPTDPLAGLLPATGGEPLARIARLGPRTLEQARSELKQFCDAMIAAEGAPDARQTADFARRACQTLALFLSEDMPRELRDGAMELAEVARQLPQSLPTWESVRRHRAESAAALALAAQFEDLDQSLHEQMEQADALVKQQPTGEPAQPWQAVPSADTIQQRLESLTRLLASGDQLVAQTPAALLRLGELTSIPAPRASGPLRERLNVQIARAAELVDESQRKLRAGKDGIDALLATARRYAGGLQRLSEWRQFVDLCHRADAIAEEALRQGPSGLQALTVQVGSERSGPFELEQRLTVGGRVVAVRNLVSSMLEAVDPHHCQVIARSDNGELVLPPATGEGPSATIRLNGNCGEMAIQLEYLVRESSRLLFCMMGPAGRPPSWSGTFTDALWSAEVQQRVAAEHAGKSARWTSIGQDLAALRAFKERLATVRLIERVGELASRLATQLAPIAATSAHATERIAQIVAAGSTDAETGRLLIPQRLAEEYRQQLADREESRRQMEEISRRQQALAGEIKARVDDVELLGLEGMPPMSALPALPAEWLALAERMSDLQLTARLAEAGKELGIQLLPKALLRANT